MNISVNPLNGDVLAKYPLENLKEVDQKLALMRRGFVEWRETTIENRAKILTSLATVLRRQQTAMATMITQEMGKPITQARAEIEKCAMLCDWYAENGPRLLQDEPAKMPSGRAYVSYLPIGAVFAVMPWNFPFWQVLRGAVAILLGGNTYVLKHSANVMGAAYMLQEAWKAAGLPDGVFSVLNIDHDLAARVIEDPRIAAVTVTGSLRAGRAVAGKAGSVLKKSVLELGGADPFIVLADADLERAVASAVEARFQNTGQVCIAGKRLIVEESILPQFTDLFVEKVKGLRMADPIERDTYIGPMARLDLRDQLQQQVLNTVREGARIVLGGEFGKGSAFDRGSFYQPTILAGVKPGMTAFREEVFGPVASLISARDAEHALELANDSDFGLSGAIWSSDTNRAQALARRMETGGVFINGMSATDPRVPVGGVKQSGYGRELSHFGLHEFMNAQTVWIDRR